MATATSASKHALFALAARLLRSSLRLLGPHTGAAAAARLAEQLAPLYTVSTAAGLLHFHCPGHVALWAVENLLTKEPDTIAWIDGFAPGAVLWDVGANIGTYALYAARRGARVVAFEPSAANYFLLNRNIALNQLDEQISAYCLALSDQSGPDQLNLSSQHIGDAGNAFGQPYDWRAHRFTPSSRQAVLGYTVDGLLDQFALPFPQHLKVDVDGIEDRIIRGATRTLADPRLRSALIELNTERGAVRDSVVAAMDAAGLRLHEVSRSPILTRTVYAVVYNHIFTRES
jgi:FkbM family methyltransferase